MCVSQCDVMHFVRIFWVSELGGDKARQPMTLSNLRQGYGTGGIHKNLNYM